jgi:hypothetical protein
MGRLRSWARNVPPRRLRDRLRRWRDRRRPVWHNEPTRPPADRTDRAFSRRFFVVRGEPAAPADSYIVAECPDFSAAIEVAARSGDRVFVQGEMLDDAGLRRLLAAWDHGDDSVRHRKMRIRPRLVHLPPSSDLPTNDVVVLDESDRSLHGLSPAQRRVLVAIGRGESRTVRELCQRVARDGWGTPLKKQTVRAALNHLAALDLVEGDRPAPPTPGRWWRTETASGRTSDRRTQVASESGRPTGE